MNDERLAPPDPVEEVARKEFEAKKSSVRTRGEWLLPLECDLGTMDDGYFPFDRMTPSDWKDVILGEPVLLLPQQKERCFFQ